MRMYTIDGTEVFVTKKIEDGFLAKEIYIRSNEDELFEEIDSKIQFYEKLYEKPVTEKYVEEISLLISEKDKLRIEIGELKKIKYEEECLLNKINKFPILKKLSDYLTGDFKFYMNFINYEIHSKEKCWITENVKVTNFKSNGWCLYKLRNENSDSYDDTPFMVFNTIDEAVEYSRIMLSEKMKQYIRNEYWSSKGFKEDFDKISYTNPVKKDPKYLEKYNETFSFLIEREKNREAKKLQKEIAEFEQKKKKLENILK